MCICDIGTWSLRDHDSPMRAAKRVILRITILVIIRVTETDTTRIPMNSAGSHGGHPLRYCADSENIPGNKQVPDGFPHVELMQRAATAGGIVGGPPPERGPQRSTPRRSRTRLRWPGRQPTQQCLAEQ